MGVLDKFLDAIKLNDDYDDEDEYYDDDESFEDEKPRKRFFKKLEDEDDNYEEASSVTNFKKAERTAQRQAKPVKMTSSKVTPMRNTKKQGAAMEVCVIKPTSMEDAREIADTLIAHCTIILNLEGLDVEVAQRIIDFASGSSYSLDGNLQEISQYIFILTPTNVDITGDFQNIINGAFDIPSIRTDFS